MTNKISFKQADALSIVVYDIAIEFGLSKEQAQMILNVAHDIALNGEQTHAPELLSQFY